MIRPEGFRGAAFGTLDDGDPRLEQASRAAVSGELAIAAQWAWVDQVHGAGVVEATAPGVLGEADALFTKTPGLPVSVRTADCVPIVVEADDAVAVVHAGWRGAAAGVVERALEAMAAAGSTPVRAAIGPAIGPCCYEVGAEVADAFPQHVHTTTWGTRSIDLRGVVAGQLAGLTLWASPQCTFTDPGLASFRRDGTARRQVAVGWLPAA